jgi:hypothetical protein
MINDAGIGYVGNDKKDSIGKAMNEMVGVFREIQKHRDTLSMRRKTMFNTPLLLAISKAQNIQRGSPGNINQTKLEHLINQVERGKKKWPSRYHKRKKENNTNDHVSERVGEAILIELENAVAILSQHCMYLKEQEGRNDQNRARLEPIRPTAANTKVEIRKKRP